MKSRLVLLGVAALLAVGLTAPAFGGANALSSGAVSAKSTADKALAKANKALKKAKAAESKANAAQTTADAALTSANNAKDAADAAQATADSALTAANSKYDVVNYQSEPNSASNEASKTAITTCPAGDRVVGGGYTLTGDPNGAYVSINAPYGNTAWIVIADDGLDADPWSIQISANCISS
jgi:hypothetical protein